MILILHKMNKEQDLNNFVSARKAEGIPDNFLPLTNRMNGNNNSTRKYFGYPTFRNYEEKQNRMLTYEEAKRLFEKVPSCIIKMNDDMEFNEVWHSKMLKCWESTYAFEQKYWLDSEWDHLWAHAFSEDSHLPISW